MTDRVPIPPDLRSEILIANQHACCICGEADVHINHTDGDPSNNEPANLSVLCQRHHAHATAPSGMTARLTPDQIDDYKTQWEAACADRIQRGARGRTAFFMVDYKNAERICQLFAQLSKGEFEAAYEIVAGELPEETSLRQHQGFDISTEPNLEWGKPIETLLPYIKSGSVHPDIFKGVEGHPADQLLPLGPAFAGPQKPYYDIWCQLMVRALVATRAPFLMKDLIQLPHLPEIGLAGKLIAFEGSLNGKVAYPAEWQENPVSTTRLTVSDEHGEISVTLNLKTHYIYSETATHSLSDGRGCGLLLLRSIDSVQKQNKRSIIVASATPLIIGSGGGGFLQIP